MTKAKKTGATKKTAAERLDQLWAKVKGVLGRETPNIVEAGEVFLEIRKHLKEERKFTREVKANLDLSIRTVSNYCEAATYAKRKGNSVTIAEMANVSPGVFFDLAYGRLGYIETEIWRLAKAGERVDQGRVKVLHDAHEKREQEKREREAREQEARQAKPKAKPETSKPEAAPEPSEPIGAPAPEVTPIVDATGGAPAPAPVSPGTENAGNASLETETKPPAPGAALEPAAEGTSPPDADDVPAGAGDAEKAKPEPSQPPASLPPPGSRDPVLADFDAMVIRLNSFVSKFIDTFDDTKIGGETLRRVADFLIDVANRKKPSPFEPPKRKPIDQSAETTDNSAETMKAVHAAAEHDADPPAKMRWGHTMVGDRDMSKSGGEGVTYWVERVTTWTDEHTGTDNFKIWFADNGEFNAAKSISDNVELKTKEAAKAFAARHRSGLVKPMVEQGLSQIPPTALSATKKRGSNRGGRNG